MIQPTGYSQKPGLFLLNLPVEIRTLVYHHLFTDARLTLTANPTFDWPKDTASKNLILVPSEWNASTSLLYTCRQIRDEIQTSIYSQVSFVFVQKRHGHPLGFNRFSYEYFDHVRPLVRRIYGVPLHGITGNWFETIVSEFPKLEVAGLDFDIVVPVVEIRVPRAPFPEMTEERLLKASKGRITRLSMQGLLDRARERMPNLQVLVTINFVVGHVDEGRSLHFMTVVDVVNMRIVETLFKHESCSLRFKDNQWQGCTRRHSWTEILDFLQDQPLPEADYRPADTNT